MYPEKYYSWLLVLFYLGGYYRPSTESRFKRYGVLMYNMLVVFICQVYYTPAEWFMLKETSKDLTTFLEHVGMLITHLLGNFKVIIMYTFFDSIIHIMDTLKSKDFQYEDYIDYKPGEYMFKCRRISRILVVSFAAVASFVPLSKQIDGYILFVKNGHLIGEGNVTCQDILPYYSWFPFNTETTMRCFIASVVQFVPMLLYVYQIVSMDILFGTCCIYIRGHFINIAGAFRTMRRRCLARLDYPPNFEVINDSDDPKLEKEIAAEVRKMSVHLQTIIDTCQELEDVIKFVVLGQAMVTLFAVVTCLYMISNEPLFSPVFLAESHYILGVCFELCIYCAFGNEVTQYSSEVTTGIFESEWFSCTKSVKSTIIINMIRLQLPIYFSIGMFTPLTLNTFLQIMKGSYSYYAFLSNSKSM